MSICAKCGSESFEAVSVIPKGCVHEVLFIQCESCKGVVGVIDSDNIDTIRRIVEEITEKIADKSDFSI